MKAMRKDRSRRYRSASELSDDIQNYLTGAPLIAGPESNVYRAKKFVHKHAGFVASAALVAVVIVLGLITSTAFSFSAEKARGEEAAARAEAEEARDKEAALRAQVEQAPVRAENAEKTADVRVRFTAKGLRSQRKRLDLSAAEYAQLVGVTPQAIYKWERETADPRKEQIAMLAALRGVGKKEAQARLQQLRSKKQS
jgi:DNA-binding transcriptional regulator YiaG